MSKKTRELVSILSLVVVLSIITINSSSIVGFLGRGFDTSTILQQFFLYSALATGSIIGVTSAWFIAFLITKDDAKYGSSIFFNSPGEFPSLKFFKKFTSLQIFLASVIFFGFAGILASTTRQESFTGVRLLEQQFTEVGSITFSSLLIPAAENLGLAAIIAFTMVLGLRALARKYDLGKDNFAIFTWIGIPLLAGLLGVANHLLRYSDSEIALVTVFFFWTLGGVLTVMVGSFIPFWVMHIMNNLFFDLQRFFSNEILLIWTIVSLVGLSVLYFFVYRGRLFGGDE